MEASGEASGGRGIDLTSCSSLWFDRHGAEGSVDKKDASGFSEKVIDLSRRACTGGGGGSGRCM